MDLDDSINVDIDCMKTITALKDKEYNAVKLKHSNSHTALMNKVDLFIKKNEKVTLSGTLK